jgi:hypothetical protein
LTLGRDLGQLLRIVSDSIHPHPPAPFDERSALAELEQLADKIQLSRRQREKALAEFDAFVKTFRYDRYTSSIAATDRELRRAEDRAPAATAAGTHAARATMPTPEVAEPQPPAVSPSNGASTVPAAVVTIPSPIEPGAPAADDREAVPSEADSSPWGTGIEREPLSHASRSFPRVRAAHVGVGLATLAVLAVAVLLWRSSSGPVGPTTPTNPSVAPASGGSSAAAQTPSTSAPTLKPTTPAGPPRALNIEFITTRPVWARITIDGRKAMEREFPADQRIPLGADRGIVIRAGDAGAIRLVVDGKDLGPLGKDGQIFSRAFTPAGR